MPSRLTEHPGLGQLERFLSGGPPSPAIADLLATIGVTDIERASRNLQSLALHPAFPRDDDAFLLSFFGTLEETFEPERALANLERIIDTRESPDAFLSMLRKSRERLSMLLTLAGGSQSLSDTLLRHPDYLDWLLRPATLRKTRSKEKMWSELWRWILDAGKTADAAARVLRQFRQREYLHIGLRDLMRRSNLVETTRALSDLADVCIEAALRVALHELEGMLGKPRHRVPDGRWRRSKFAVIAMGKHGGQELNFSSDIDLLFIYASDDGQTSGARRPISNHEFFTKLSRRLITMLSENTEEGHVFRVDMRLRPEGDQGALAYSLRSCEIYYESWGETWERQALIKARPAAGSAALGREFIETIRPFIYRRTLDISALDEIGRIKDRINRKLAARPRNAMNIKLGEGGIREIEFIAQSFQLIYGGKESILQTHRTLDALKAIQALGLMGIETCEALAEAYVFLRDVEHRIQVTHGLQTHDLPADVHRKTVLARKMGFQPDRQSALKEFEAALQRHQDRVASVFEGLFRSRAPEVPGPVPEAPAVPESAETLEDSLSPEELSPYNFSDPAAASAQLRLLRNGEPFTHVSARAKRMFDDLLPRLLYLTLDLPDADRAVANLNRFVETAGGRQAIFSLMTSQENACESLLRLFGHSDYLSDILIDQPGLLDSVLSADTLTAPRPKEALDADFAAAAKKPGRPEERFKTLCALKRAEELVIGMRCILGEADILQTLSELTDLAERTVRSVYLAAEAELQAARGGQAEFAIIGMGKLGSREMNFGSDLDLVFVYGAPEGAEDSSNGQPAPASTHERFLQLATTLRAGLTEPVPGKRTYEVDLRLRPEGKSGALVVPLEVFADYFKGRAENWERQALCRARFIAGSEAVGRAFLDLAARFIYEQELDFDLAAEVVRMRERLERELAKESEGRIDIKLGRGGIADIEFIVQYLQISHGGALPAIRRPETYEALSDLERKRLLSHTQSTALKSAYRFLRWLESRLRIARGDPVQVLPKEPEELKKLARRLDYRDDEEGSAQGKLLAAYERTTSEVRQIYLDILKVDEAAGRPGV